MPFLCPCCCGFRIKRKKCHNNRLLSECEDERYRVSSGNNGTESVLSIDRVLSADAGLYSAVEYDSHHNKTNVATEISLTVSDHRPLSPPEELLRSKSLDEQQCNDTSPACLQRSQSTEDPTAPRPGVWPLPGDGVLGALALSAASMASDLPYPREQLSRAERIDRFLRRRNSSVFKQPLEDAQFTIGAPFSLHVELLPGYQDCQVRWYHNSIAVTESSRVRISRDKVTCSLHVLSACAQDAGKWSCSLPEMTGSPTTVAALRTNVGAGGVILSTSASAESLTASLPHTLQHYSIVDSPQLPRRSQTPRQEGELEEGNHVLKISSSGFHPPILSEVLSDRKTKVGDKMILSVKVSNPETVRSVSWQHKGRPVIRSDRYQLTSDLDSGHWSLSVLTTDLNDDSEWRIVLKSDRGTVETWCNVTLAVPRNYRRPRFMENLRALLTEEGLVSFECKVVGYPTPALRWFKDGHELKPGDVYQLSGANSLGKYSCVALNCMGSAESTAELTLSDIEGQLTEDERIRVRTEQLPPKIIGSLPDNTEVKLGHAHAFIVEVTSYPDPEVIWLHNNVPVTSGGTIEVYRETPGLYRLDFQPVKIADQGEWRCVATNPSGSAETKTMLLVSVPAHFRAPHFLLPLRAALTPSGSVDLECKVIGTPQPVLHWYKDGKELKAGDIHKITAESPGSSPCGEYICEAVNCMGTTHSIATILASPSSHTSSGQSWSEGRPTLPAHIEHYGVLRDISLSTINEERTSQLTSSEHSEEAQSSPVAMSETSVQVDGAEVTVSVYGSDQLSRQEIQQVVQLYSSSSSPARQHLPSPGESISFSNEEGRSHPSLHVVKDQEIGGSVQLSATVIDLVMETGSSPAFDDTRTETGVDDLELEETQLAELSNRPYSASSKASSKKQRNSQKSESCRSEIGSEIDGNKSLISSVDSFHTADQMEPSLDSDDPTSEQVTPVPNDPDLESSNASNKSSSNDEDNPMEDVLPKLQEALIDFEPPPPKRSLLLRTYSSTECPPIIEEDEVGENDSSSSNVEDTGVDPRCLAPAEPLVTSHRQRPLVLTPSGSMQSDTEEVVSVVEAVNITQYEDKNKLDEKVVHACIALLHAVTTNEMLPKEFMSDIGRDLCSNRTQRTLSNEEASLRAEKVMQVFMTNVKINLGVVEELEQVLSPEYAGEQLTDEAKFAVQGLITALELASVGAAFTFPKISLPTERILSSFEERLSAEKILAVFRTLNLTNVERTDTSSVVCHGKEASDSIPKEELFSDISSMSSGSFALEKTFSDETKSVAKKLLTVLHAAGVDETMLESEYSDISSQASDTRVNIEPSSDGHFLENLLQIAKSVVQESQIYSCQMLELERAVSPKRASETGSPFPQLNVDQMFSYICPIVEELERDDSNFDVKDLSAVQTSLKNAIQIECQSSVDNIAISTGTELLHSPGKTPDEEAEVDGSVNLTASVQSYEEPLPDDEDAGCLNIKSHLSAIENLINKMENSSSSSSDNTLHKPVGKSPSLEGRQLSEDNNSAMSSASMVTVVSLNQVEELEDQAVEEIQPPTIDQQNLHKKMTNFMSKADEIKQIVSKYLTDPNYTKSVDGTQEMVDSLLECIRQELPDCDQIPATSHLSCFSKRISTVQSYLRQPERYTMTADYKHVIERCIEKVLSSLDDVREPSADEYLEKHNTLFLNISSNFADINEYLEKINNMILSSIDTGSAISQLIPREKRILIERFSDFERAVDSLILNTRNQLYQYDPRELVNVALIADFQQSLACLVVSLCDSVAKKDITDRLMAHMAHINGKISHSIHPVENDVSSARLDSSEEASLAYKHCFEKHKSALNLAIDHFDQSIASEVSSLKQAAIANSDVNIDAFVFHSEQITTLLSEFLMSLNIMNSEKENIQRELKSLKKISIEANEAVNKLAVLLSSMSEYLLQNNQTDLAAVSKQTVAAFERLVQKFNNCLAISMDEKDLLTINFSQMKSALQSNANNFVECCRNGNDIKVAMLKPEVTCKHFHEIVNQMRSLLLLENPKGLTNLVIVKIQEMTDYLDKSNAILNSTLSAAPERIKVPDTGVTVPSSTKQALCESSACLHSNVQALIEAIGDGSSLFNCERSVQASLRVSEVVRRYVQEATLVYGTELPNEKLRAVSKSFDALNATLRNADYNECGQTEIDTPVKLKTNLEIAGSVLRQAFQNMTILIEECTGSATETRRIIDVQLYNVKIAVEKLISAVDQFTSSLPKESTATSPLLALPTLEHKHCVGIMKEIHGVIVEVANLLRANSRCGEDIRKIHANCLQIAIGSSNQPKSVEELVECVTEKLNTIITESCLQQDRVPDQTISKRNFLVNAVVDSSNSIISDLVQKPEHVDALLGRDNNPLLVALESLITFLSGHATEKVHKTSEIIAACVQLDKAGVCFVQSLKNLKVTSDENISDETENLYATCLAIVHLLFPDGNNENIIKCCQHLRTVLEPLSSLLGKLPEEQKSSPDVNAISNQVTRAIKSMLAEINTTDDSKSSIDCWNFKLCMNNLIRAIEALHKFAEFQIMCDRDSAINNRNVSERKSRIAQADLDISSVGDHTTDHTTIEPPIAENLLEPKKELVPADTFLQTLKNKYPVDLLSIENVCSKLNTTSEIFTNALIDSLSSSKSSQSLNNCANDVNSQLESLETIICDMNECDGRTRIEKCFKEVTSDIKQLALSVGKSCQTFDDTTPLDNNVLEEVVAPAIINVSSSVFNLQEVISSFTKVFSECPLDHLEELMVNFSDASKRAAQAISKSVDDVREAISHAAEKSFVEDIDLNVSGRDDNSTSGQSVRIQTLGSSDDNEINPEIIISAMTIAASEKMLQKLSSEATMLYDKFRTLLENVECSSDSPAKTICNKAEHSTIMGQCLDIRCDLRKICRHIDSSIEEDTLQVISIEKLSDVEEKAVTIATYAEQLREAHPDLDSEIGLIDIQLQTMRDRIRKTMFIIAEKCDICSNLDTTNDEVDINKSELGCRLEDFYGVLLSEVDEDKVLEKLGVDANRSGQRLTIFGSAARTDIFNIKSEKGSSKDISEFTTLETIIEEGKSDSEGRSSAEDSGKVGYTPAANQFTATEDSYFGEFKSDQDTTAMDLSDEVVDQQCVSGKARELSQHIRYGLSQQTSIEFESFMEVTEDISEVVPTQHDAVETSSALMTEAPGEKMRHICQKLKSDNVRFKSPAPKTRKTIVESTKQTDLTFLQSASDELKLLAGVIMNTVKGKAITTKETDGAVQNAKTAITSVVESLENLYSVPNLAHSVSQLDKPLAELRDATHTSIRILRGEKTTSKLQKHKISDRVSLYIEKVCEAARSINMPLDKIASTFKSQNSVNLSQLVEDTVCLFIKLFDSITCAVLDYNRIRQEAIAELKSIELVLLAAERLSDLKECFAEVLQIIEKSIKCREPGNESMIGVHAASGRHLISKLFTAITSITGDKHSAESMQDKFQTVFDNIANNAVAALSKLGPLTFDDLSFDPHYKSAVESFSKISDSLGQFFSNFARNLEKDGGANISQLMQQMLKELVVFEERICSSTQEVEKAHKSASSRFCIDKNNAKLIKDLDKHFAKIFDKLEGIRKNEKIDNIENLLQFSDLYYNVLNKYSSFADETTEKKPSSAQMRDIKAGVDSIIDSLRSLFNLTSDSSVDDLQSGELSKLCDAAKDAIISMELKSGKLPQAVKLKQLGGELEANVDEIQQKVSLKTLINKEPSPLKSSDTHGDLLPGKNEETAEASDALTQKEVAIADMGNLDEEVTAAKKIKKPTLKKKKKTRAALDTSVSDLKKLSQGTRNISSSAGQNTGKVVLDSEESIQDTNNAIGDPEETTQDTRKISRDPEKIDQDTREAIRDSPETSQDTEQSYLESKKSSQDVKQSLIVTNERKEEVTDSLNISSCNDVPMISPLSEKEKPKVSSLSDDLPESKPADEEFNTTKTIDNEHRLRSIDDQSKRFGTEFVDKSSTDVKSSETLTGNNREKKLPQVEDKYDNQREDNEDGDSIASVNNRFEEGPKAMDSKSPTSSTVHPRKSEISEVLETPFETVSDLQIYTNYDEVKGRKLSDVFESKISPKETRIMSPPKIKKAAAEPPRVDSSNLKGSNTKVEEQHVLKEEKQKESDNSISSNKIMKLSQISDTSTLTKLQEHESDVADSGLGEISPPNINADLTEKQKEIKQHAVEKTLSENEQKCKNEDKAKSGEMKQSLATTEQTDEPEESKNNKQKMLNNKSVKETSTKSTRAPKKNYKKVSSNEEMPASKNAKEDLDPILNTDISETSDKEQIKNMKPKLIEQVDKPTEQRIPMHERNRKPEPVVGEGSVRELDKTATTEESLLAKRNRNERESRTEQIDTMNAPTFKSELKVNYCQDDDTMMVECQLTGHPAPDVSWLKNSIPLPTSKRFRQKFSPNTGHCKLVVRCPRDTDSGRYCCVAVNCVDQAILSQVISVPPRRLSCSPETEILGTRHAALVADSPNVETCRDKFTRSDQSITRNVTDDEDSESISDRSAVTEPVVTSHNEWGVTFRRPATNWRLPGWRRMGVVRPCVLFVSRKMPTPDRGDADFLAFISSLKERQRSAWLSRRPRSLGGPVKETLWSSGSIETFPVDSAMSNRSLTSLAQRKSSTFIEEAEFSQAMAVRFIEKPDDMIYAIKGGDVTLTCVIQGTPKPKVSLHRGRVDVLACHRAELTVNGSCYQMHLRAMQYCDSGTYCIHAQNNSSQDRSYVLIRVKEPGRAQTPDWHTRRAARLMAGAELLNKGHRSTRVEPGVLPCAPRIRDVGEDWVSLHWSRPLECGGGPVLSYRVDAWLRGEDAMWQTMTTSLICSAELYGLRKNRCYIFRVTPRNKFGWGEGVTTEPVVVGAKRQPPVFRTQLAPVTKALLGGPLVLQCQVDSGEMAVQVVWLHEGVPLLGSSSGGGGRSSKRRRVRTSCSRRHGQLQLVVSELLLTDSGSYTCQVSNSVGSVSSYSRLQVVEREVLLQADSNISRALSLVLCDEDEEESCAARDQCYLAPFFLIRPRDRRAEAGCSVRLTCQVTGWPVPEVTWLFHDELIQSNERMSVKAEENYFHSLEIYPVKQSDIGQYTVRAANSSGVVQVHFKLAVDSGLHVYRCPTLTRALSDTCEAAAGAGVTMETRASAQPAISVIWRFDGRRLRVRRNQLNELSVSELGSCKLRLGSLTQLNSGHYSCTFSNEAGSCSSSCQLTVKSPATAGSGSPPVFVRHPASSYVRVGEPLTISCQVTGQPAAEVTLLRADGSQSVETSDQYPCVLTPLGNGVYLTSLSSVSAEDQGTYRLVASNQSGSTESSVFIRLLPSDSGDNGQINSIFVRQLEDIRCCDGDDVTLVTCFSSAGLRRYSVRWEKDGVEVADRGGVYRTDQTVCEKRGTVECRLTVAPAFVDDEGQYVCLVTDLNTHERHLAAACVIVDESDDDVHLSRMLAARDISPPSPLSPAVTARASVDKTIRSPASAHPPSSHLNMASLNSRLTAARSRAVSEQPSSSSPSYSAATSYGSGRQRRVAEAPHFLMAPHDRTAQEGEVVTFKCSVTGCPSPATSWYHDSLIIRNTEKHRMTEIGEERMLTIRNVRRSDAGVYKITLENDAGHCQASCRLIVLGKSVSASSAIPTSSHHQSRRHVLGSSSSLTSRGVGLTSGSGYGSRAGGWRDSSRFLKSSAVSSCHWDHDMEMIPTECPSLLMDDSRRPVTEGKYHRPRAPPVFVRPLRDMTVTEGSPCRLDVTVCGSDPIFVDWLRDEDTPLPDCEDFCHSSSSEGNRSLVMADTYLEDSGVYSCQASNSFGSTVSSCRLTVAELSGKVCGQSCSASDWFSSELKVTEGSNLRFWVRPLDGMRVKWILNGCKVKKHSLQTERVRVTNDETGSSLQLNDAQVNDTGALTVSVITPVSDWQSTVSLYVTTAPTNGHSSNYSFADSALSDDVISDVISDVTDCNGHSSASFENSVVIVSPPASSEALLGQKVSLVCQFEVISNDLSYRPEVAWSRAGQTLASEDRVRIERGDDFTSMTLSGVTADDSGKYEVRVGGESRVVSVSVLGPPDPPAGEPQLSRTLQGCLSVSWQGPAYDGGSAITGYSVSLLPPSACLLPPGQTSSLRLAANCQNTWFALSRQQTEQLQTGSRLFISACNRHGVSDPGMAVMLTQEDISGLASPSQHPLLPASLSEQILQEDVPAPFEHRKVSVEKCEDFDQLFDVQEELGKGRFGTVHKVVERESGTRYAAKRVKCIRQSDRTRVEDEIAMMNDLQHPRLLQLAAAYHCGKQVVMLLEYVSGGELFERVVADDFTLTEHQCALFMQQICSGMQYMHEANIMHLDLKPENILCLTKSSHQIKIIDFGLARRYDNAQPVQAMQGTPEFVPPEVINFEPLSLTSDMWSVGVICYILLSGLSPFMGDNDRETFANITRSDYDFDDEAFDNVSEIAKNFISQLLVKQQQYRMSAAEACSHEWVTAGQVKLKANVICKEKLKKFIIRRKWQKTGTAIRAIGRMAANLQRSTNKQLQEQKEQEEQGKYHAAENQEEQGGSGDPRAGKRDSVYSDRSDSGISDCSVGLALGVSSSTHSASMTPRPCTVTEEVEEDTVNDQVSKYQ